MPAFSLSKSTYIRGLQCLKSLYLNKHRSFLRDRLSEEQLAKFARGHAIGKVARQLFPDGVEIPAPSEASARKTQKLIAEGYPVIYEACFIHNEVIIAVDILVNDGNGWSAYEVKSSDSLSDTYYNDAYLQNYVITGSGLRLNRFFLVHRDAEVEVSDYKDVKALFVFREIEQPDELKTSKIELSIKEMKKVLSQHHSPAILPGYQCMHPYPCDFRGFCWKDLKDDERTKLLNG